MSIPRWDEMRGEKKADIDVYKPSCGHRDMEYWTEHVVLRERDKRHGNGGTTVNGKRTEVEYGDSGRVGDIWGNARGRVFVEDGAM